jgi:hypothetical protein
LLRGPHDVAWLFLNCARFSVSARANNGACAPIKVSQTSYRPGRNNDHGWLAVLGDGLRLAPCRIDDLAEPVFGVLEGPGAMRHLAWLRPLSFLLCYNSLPALITRDLRGHGSI